MRPALLVAAAAAAAVVVVVAVALAPSQVEAQPTSPATKRLAPRARPAGWSHAPFEAGACDSCHRSNDVKAPGPVATAVPGLCTSCHDELLEKTEKLGVKHKPLARCTACHNPHNGADARLLIDDVPGLCLGCHARTAKQSKHPSGAAGKAPAESKCVVCHDPHAAKKAKLLKG